MTFTIRPATPDDAATILGFITELAVYEKAGHEVAATEDSIRQSIFGEGSVTERALHGLIASWQPAATLSA